MLVFATGSFSDPPEFLFHCAVETSRRYFHVLGALLAVVGLLLLVVVAPIGPSVLLLLLSINREIAIYIVMFSPLSNFCCKLNKVL
jgi:hypothetical protein